MDPLSAIISAVGSLAGSALSYGSAQSAQSQQAYAAGGGYLPSLVMNAQKAGLSPLAVLGYHAPSVGNVVGDPSGVANAGRALAEIKDPHTVAMERLQERLGQSEILRRESEMGLVQLQTAKERYMLEMLQSGSSMLNTANSWMTGAGKAFNDATTVDWGKVGAGISTGAKSIFGPLFAPNPLGPMQ